MNTSMIFLFLMVTGSPLFVSFIHCHTRQITSEFFSESFDNASVFESNWIIEDNNNNISEKVPIVSKCGTKSILGGYQTYLPSIKKTFILPKLTDIQSSLTISFELYLIDKWTSGYEGAKTKYQFLMKLDEQQIFNLGSNYHSGVHKISQNICGDSTPDRVTKVSVTVPFSGKEFTLNLQVNSKDETQPFWGIRELSIYFDLNQSVQTIIVSELSDQNNFGEQNWKNISSIKDSLVNNCGTEKLIGGKNQPGTEYIRNTIYDLPEHTFVRIKVKSFWVDSMDVDDSVIFFLDGEIVHEQSKNKAYEIGNLYGKVKYSESVQDIEIIVPHRGNTATIKILQNSNQRVADENFGFNSFIFSTSMPCPIIYSEVNKQGKSLQFCGDIPNLKNYGWKIPIKGIYIPENEKIEYFEKANYEGRKIIINQTNFDLTGRMFVLINKVFKVELEEIQEGERNRRRLKNQLF